MIDSALLSGVLTFPELDLERVFIFMRFWVQVSDGVVRVICTLVRVRWVCLMQYDTAEHNPQSNTVDHVCL